MVPGQVGADHPVIAHARAALRGRLTDLADAALRRAVDDAQVPSPSQSTADRRPPPHSPRHTSYVRSAPFHISHPSRTSSCFVAFTTITQYTGDGGALARAVAKAASDASPDLLAAARAAAAEKKRSCSMI